MCVEARGALRPFEPLEKARNALTRKVDADKKKREKVKQDAIKNQKI